MKRERFIEILKQDRYARWNGDNAFKGLQILSKYTDDLIQGAGKDVIYSCDVDVLIEGGITEKEAIELRDLNWMVEFDDYLACFV
jgi:hypothetical protein